VPPDVMHAEAGRLLFFARAEYDATFENPAHYVRRQLLYSTA
jgi:hypothetical protein